MKITTAIFDLDGTLLNTLGDLADSVNAVLVRHGYPQLSESDIQARVGNGIRSLIAKSIPEEFFSEALTDACLDEFRTEYEKRMMNRTQPYDGILPLLKTLKKEGVTIGVLSNKYDLAAKGLVRHYFGDLCQKTFGERPEIARKPDPTGALKLMKALGANPDTTLYIGDSGTDMQTAKNAGLTAIGVTWGFRSADVLLSNGADALVNHPSELLALFENGLLNIDAVRSAFTKNGFSFTYFATKEQATAYLSSVCAGKVVTFGGSQTLKELNAYETLSQTAEVHSHSVTPGHFKQDPDIYITSANALSETGEIVNIDGVGNRVSATLFGAKHCIFVCGTNKLSADLQSAMHRARTIAAPLNATRLQCKTPCAVDQKCHNCSGPNRICRGMAIHMMPMMHMDICEIVLVGESLGF